MAQGMLTPLQLSAGSALLTNQGIVGLPIELTTALDNYNNTTTITNFFAAVVYYIAQPWHTVNTLTALLSIGNNTCPALGNSIPIAYTNLTPSDISPFGFSGLIQHAGQNYLGNSDNGRFAQGFMAVQGYISTINQFINSAVNAKTYFGPTFTSMDALATNQISDMNPDFAGFGTDLARQGQLTNLANLNNYGTPGALLHQIAAVAGLQGGTLSSVNVALIGAGLTTDNIKTLLTGQDTVTPNQYNLLQRLAYTGMKTIAGADLQNILSILDVTTPNINTLADLLDQTKIFPNSYTTLQTPTPEGPVLIYGPGNSVNTNVAGNVANYLTSATGCDELSKVIPQAIAVANKAVQIAIQQITGISNTTLPALAEAVQGYTLDIWSPDSDYLADAVVSDGQTIPTYYRAQQDVLAGTNINNTAYWLPTTLCGLSTMAGLPAIQAQTSAITQEATDDYVDLASGTGPNGTITTCDVLGTAIDFNDFASRLTTATENIITLQGLGLLTALNNAYVAILLAGNDAAAVLLINDANVAIAALSADPNYATLNIAWNYIANYLNKEKGYQTTAGIDYNNLQAGEQVSIMGFVQQLAQYGTQTESCGPASFLTKIADTSIPGGQAIVGAMREAQNQQCLSAAGLGTNYIPSSTPAVTPVPAVTPIY